MVHIIFFPFTDPWGSQSALAHSRLWEFQKQRNLTIESFQHFLNLLPNPFSPSTENPAELRFYGTEFEDPRNRGMSSTRKGESFWTTEPGEGSLFIDSLSKHLQHTFMCPVPFRQRPGMQIRFLLRKQHAGGRAWAGTWGQAGFEQMKSQEVVALGCKRTNSLQLWTVHAFHWHF